MREADSIFRSAAVVSFFTILSRIAGLVRDVLVSRLLGTSHAADAFNLAFRIPNLLRRLTAEGATSAAFIPVFSSEDQKHGRKAAMLFAANCLSLALAIMALLTVLGIVFAPSIIRIYAWGFHETAGKAELTVLLTRIMFPYMLLISLAALGMGILNSVHVFGPPAAGPILLNLTIIGSALTIAPRLQEPAVALAGGVVVGGILQVLLQVPALIKAGLPYRWGWDYRHPAIRRMARLLLPGMLGLGVTQINALVGSAFASMAGEGAVTAYYLSDRLLEFLLGVYAIAISTAILPVLSRQAIEGNWKDYSSLFSLALRLVTFLAIPASVGLALLRIPIISTLFEHGRFDSTSSQLTATPLLFSAAGLTAIAALKIIVPAYYARQDTRTPVATAVVAMVVNFSVNLLLINPLGVAGPAVAAVSSGWVNCLILYLLLRKKLCSGHQKALIISLIRSIAATIPAAILLYWSADGIVWLGLAFWERCMALAGIIILTASCYLTAARLLQCPELHELAALLGLRSLRNRGER